MIKKRKLSDALKTNYSSIPVANLNKDGLMPQFYCFGNVCGSRDVHLCRVRKGGYLSMRMVLFANAIKAGLYIINAHLASKGEMAVHASKIISSPTIETELLISYTVTNDAIDLYASRNGVAFSLRVDTLLNADFIAQPIASIPEDCIEATIN